MATFNGIQLGIESTVRDKPNPLRVHRTTFAGSSGADEQIMGGDGGTVEVECPFTAGNAAILVGIYSTLITLKLNGTYATLEDDIGRQWTCRLDLIEDVDRVIPSDDSTGLLRKFKLTFLYLY